MITILFRDGHKQEFSATRYQIGLVDEPLRLYQGDNLVFSFEHEDWDEVSIDDGDTYSWDGNYELTL